MDDTICKLQNCTACNACLNICPIDCITYCIDEVSGTSYAVRNEEKCIKCGLCKKVCSQLEGYEKHLSYHCYAAWSLNEETKKKSASGGIASEIYKYCIERGGIICGVIMNDKHEAVYYLTDNPSYISKFQNSKYVHSNAGYIYRNIGEKLEKNVPVVFIGLPCQVAALLRFLEVKKISSENLLTVDLVCHGTTPSTFFKEHISRIESKFKRKAEEIYFRDSEFGTKNYFFTLRERGKVFYKKPVKDTDVYQVGYHYGISYRSNCYSCIFTNINRPGDLTLGDFHGGLGKYAPCNYSRENVSCVLVNTEKGKQLLESLSRTGIIFIEERPIKEELDYEKQLNHPTVISNERKIFLDQYSKTKDFNSSIKKSTGVIIRNNQLKRFLKIETIKTIVRKILPKGALNFIKGKLN